MSLYGLLFELRHEQLGSKAVTSRVTEYIKNNECQFPSVETFGNISISVVPRDLVKHPVLIVANNNFAAVTHYGYSGYKCKILNYDSVTFTKDVIIHSDWFRAYALCICSCDKATFADFLPKMVKSARF